MNRNVRDIYVRNFLSEPEGWGRVQGGSIQRALLAKIEHNQTPELIRLSLADLKRIDVTFAAEVIAEPVRRFLGIKAICAICCPDSDIAENVAAAALLARVPITIWTRDVPQVTGPMPRAGCRAALDFALRREEVRATDVASALRISIANASTKLKQLSEAGYLLRDEGASKSGGPEFIYRRIG
jgi:hypothetical protein